MRSFVLAMMLVVSAVFVGCAPSMPKLPPVAPVKGTVQLDGKPMATGEIVFTLAGMPEHRIAVNNGAYAGEAMVGANQVGVFSYIESAPDSGLSTDEVKKTNVVADRFSYRTTLTAEVKEAKPEAPNELNFTATTR